MRIKRLTVLWNPLEIGPEKFQNTLSFGTRSLRMRFGIAEIKTKTRIVSVKVERGYVRKRVLSLGELKKVIIKKLDPEQIEK